MKPRSYERLHKVNNERSGVEGRAVSGLIGIKLLFVWDTGRPPTGLPRRSWIRLNLYKPVMVWLHTADQSMDAILLDKCNESLLILSHRKETHSICVRFPRAVRLLFIRVYRGQKTPTKLEGRSGSQQRFHIKSWELSRSGSRFQFFTLQLHYKVVKKLFIVFFWICYWDSILFSLQAPQVWSACSVEFTCMFFHHAPGDH